MEKDQLEHKWILRGTSQETSSTLRNILGFDNLINK